MKRFFTLIITVVLFAITLVIGLKNQQPVNINYLVAQSEMALSTLLAILFMVGFICSTFFAFLFYLKLKMKNRRLHKLNKKQRKELNKLRTLSTNEKD